MPKKTYNVQGIPHSNGNFRMNDQAISSGMSFLVSELEKLDPRLLEPLTSVTYPRDINIETGGGWVESESTMNVDYAVSGGLGDAVGGGAANAIRIMQANFGKDIHKVFPYEVAMKMKFIDVQRSNLIGRSLEKIYDDGIRLDFDKYLDANTYIGQPLYGTTGLTNNPNVAVTSAASNGSGASTKWRDKSADEILADVNEIIVSAWKASGYDQSAVPNHLLIPASQYAYLASQKVSLAADKTILIFLLENNIAKEKGVNLFIGDCQYCEGAGTGGTDRMIAYVNNSRFTSESIPVPLGRAMTQPNVQTATYDSLFVANVGTVKINYLEPFRYVDGI